MTLDVLFVGGAAILVGLAFCAAGYPLFLVLLPIWAFLTGFLGAAGATSTALGGGFLATTTGIAVGLGAGVIFAVLAYAFWWAGVLLLGISLGYLLGAGLVDAIGIGPGVISFVVGAIGAVILGVAFFMLHMPRLLVIVATAVGGAAMAVGGALLLLNQVPLDDFATGPIRAISDGGPIAMISAVALAIVGIVAQLRLSAGTEVQIWRGAVAASDE